MVAGWRRAGAGLGLALAALALSGCRVQGTFDVLSEDRVGMDFVITGDDAQCANAAYVMKLSATTISNAPGERACRIFGQTQATYFSPFGVDVSRAAEYLVLQTSLAPGADDWPSSDIHIRFPGQIVTASRGVVVGNEVEINDLALLGEGAGLRVVALSQPGPPAWMIAAGIGAGVGIALAGLVVALVRLARRPRRVDPELISLEPAELPADGSPPSTDAGPDGHREDAGLSPPGADPPAPAVGEQETTWCAAPPAPPEWPDAPLSPDTTGIRASLEHAFADAQARPEPEEPPDHSVWAPPADRS